MSTLCDYCGEPMRPEHAHERCPACGALTTCCEGVPQTERTVRLSPDAMAWALIRSK